MSSSHIWQLVLFEKLDMLGIICDSDFGTLSLPMFITNKETMKEQTFAVLEMKIWIYGSK